MDLSVDHKPETESEQARIQQHYDSIHGANSFRSRSSIMSDMMVGCASGACLSRDCLIIVYPVPNVGGGRGGYHVTTLIHTRDTLSFARVSDTLIFTDACVCVCVCTTQRIACFFQTKRRSNESEWMMKACAAHVGVGARFEFERHMYIYLKLIFN